MTTIAYRDGIIAADGRAAVGDIVRHDDLRKIWSVHGGGVVAATGATADAMPLVDWIIKFGCWSPPPPPKSFFHSLDRQARRPERPEISDDCRVIWILPSRLIRVYESKGYFTLDNPKFAAWGSGDAAALGAMAMGASAKKAVEVAARFDVYTGGRITTLRLVPHNLADEGCA